MFQLIKQFCQRYKKINGTAAVVLNKIKSRTRGFFCCGFKVVAFCYYSQGEVYYCCNQSGILSF